MTKEISLKATGGISCEDSYYNSYIDSVEISDEDQSIFISGDGMSAEFGFNLGRSEIQKLVSYLAEWVMRGENNGHKR